MVGRDRRELADLVGKSKKKSELLDSIEKANRKPPPKKPKKPDDRNKQFSRMLNELRILYRVDGRTLKELSVEFGVSVRTIQRDLKCLMDADFILEETLDDDGKKRWRLLYKDKLKDLIDLLDLQHYMAILVLAGQNPTLKDSEINMLVQDFQQKLEKLFSKEDRILMGKMMMFFSSATKFGYRDASPGQMYGFFDAWMKGLVCHVRYQSPKPGAPERILKVAPREVRPYDHAFWLTYWSVKHDAPGTINMQQIIDVKITQEKFTVPESFDVDEYWESEFGVPWGGPKTKYVFEFEAAVAAYIRRRHWNRSEALEELPGGRLRLTFTCGASPEVDAFALSWGGDIDVIEPAPLRIKSGEVGLKNAMRYLTPERIAAALAAKPVPAAT